MVYSICQSFGYFMSVPLSRSVRPLLHSVTLKVRCRPADAAGKNLCTLLSLLFVKEFLVTMPMCPGIDRLKNILTLQELESLQARYNKIASGDTPFDSSPDPRSDIDPLRCSAWRLGRIRGAIGDAMPTTVFARYKCKFPVIMASELG